MNEYSVLTTFTVGLTAVAGIGIGKWIKVN